VPPLGKSGALAVAASLLSLPFLLPHVLEDFDRGIAERAGLSTGVAAALLGAGLAVQMLGLVLVGRGLRAGLVVTSAAGIIWTMGTAWDHGPDLVRHGLAFRAGVLSALWVLGLAAGQALAALFALAALIAEPTPGNR
jgi:hypothetical protein